MGNRGILHDDDQVVRKTHTHQNWVSCVLSFNGNKRTLMAPRSYTELFFLDEATALAAGHRPCATCRRDRYRIFTTLWVQVHGAPPDGTPLPKAIDKALHTARIKRGEKMTFETDFETLPDGVIVESAGAPYLKWRDKAFAWSLDGYVKLPTVITGPVTVLTPYPLIAVLQAGYDPKLHPSLPV